MAGLVGVAGYKTLRNLRLGFAACSMTLTSSSFSSKLRCMADMDNVLDAAADQQRAALVKVIRSKPTVTLADLSALLHGRLGPILGSITIADLTEGAADSNAGAPSSNFTARREGRNGQLESAGGTARRRVVTMVDDEAGPASVESRTAAGRARYDEALLEVLREHAGQPLSAGELRGLAGGSDLQARAALQRLVDSGAVVRTGKARGTRYASVDD